MRSVTLWRIGSLLLVGGGLMGVLGQVLANAVPAALWPGVWLAAVGVVATGLAIAATGVAMGRRLPACVLLMIGGGLLALEGAAEMMFAAAVAMPGWIALALSVSADLVLLAAAVATVLRGRLGGTAAWILVPPTAWLVLTAALLRLAPRLSLWWMPLVTSALFAVAGVVWLRLHPAPARAPRAEPAPASVVT